MSTEHKEQNILALMERASQAAQDPALSELQKANILATVGDSLDVLGVDFLIGEEENQGFLLGVTQHLPGCHFPISPSCKCPPQYKVKGTLGD